MPDQPVPTECTLLRRRDPKHMLDREKIVSVLKRRFPGAAADQVAAAANAIVGLDDEWEEFPEAEVNWATARPLPCEAGCLLLERAHGGGRFRVYWKRSPE
jgi:hypothetical protein